MFQPFVTGTHCLIPYRAEGSYSGNYTKQYLIRLANGWQKLRQGRTKPGELGHAINRISSRSQGFKGYCMTVADGK
jgi:hypothetical protein